MALFLGGVAEQADAIEEEVARISNWHASQTVSILQALNDVAYVCRLEHPESV